MNQHVSLTFSLKYLVNFSKSTSLSDTVQLMMSNDVPLLVSCDFVVVCCSLACAVRSASLSCILRESVSCCRSSGFLHDVLRVQHHTFRLSCAFSPLSQRPISDFLLGHPRFPQPPPYIIYTNGHSPKQVSYDFGQGHIRYYLAPKIGDD